MWTIQLIYSAVCFRIGPIVLVKRNRFMCSGLSQKAQWRKGLWNEQRWNSDLMPLSSNRVRQCNSHLMHRSIGTNYSIHFSLNASLLNLTFDSSFVLLLYRLFRGFFHLNVILYARKKYSKEKLCLITQGQWFSSWASDSNLCDGHVKCFVEIIVLMTFKFQEYLKA